MSGNPVMTAKSITITGSGAPTMTPAFIGQEYYDTVSGNIYKAIGTNGSYNWGFIGKGLTQAFAKNSISSLTVWYEFDDDAFMTLDANGGINILKNKTGDTNYDLTQATAGYRPVRTLNRINGLPTALFNPSGPSFMERDTADIAQPITLFLVFKASHQSNALVVPFGGGGNVYLNLNYTSAGYVTGATSIYAGAYSQSIGTFTSGAANLLACTYSGVNSLGSLNGAADVTLSPSTNTCSGIALGRLYGSSYYLAGDIAALLIYSRALNTAEKDYVKGYLNNKYAIY